MTDFKKDKKLRELWSRFKSMSPEERNETLQAFFSEACMEDDDSLSLKDRLAIFQILVRSFEVSAKFESLKGSDNELFGDPVGGLRKVPQPPASEPETGTTEGDSCPA